MTNMIMGLILAVTFVNTIQEPLSSQRAAAVRFAIANGLHVTTQDVVVATDTLFKNIDDKERTLKTAGERSDDARAIAQLFGKSAQTGSGDDLLWCQQSRCAPRGAYSVIVVNQPVVNRNGTLVSVAAYSPSDQPLVYDGMLSMAVVEIEFKNGGWIGVRNYLGPSKQPVKVMK